jgi:ribosomal protein S17
MIRIPRKNDEQNKDVHSNSDKVVARDIALISFKGLAHHLVSLHAEVQVYDDEYHEAVDHSENLLAHDDPVAEAKIG